LIGGADETDWQQRKQQGSHRQGRQRCEILEHICI
jgi:hypothetical protein